MFACCASRRRSIASEAYRLRRWRRSRWTIVAISSRTGCLNRYSPASHPAAALSEAISKAKGGVSVVRSAMNPIPIGPIPETIMTAKLRLDPSIKSRHVNDVAWRRSR